MADLTRLAPPLPGGFTQDDVEFLLAQGFVETNGGNYRRGGGAGSVNLQCLCFNHWPDNPLEGARRKRGWYAVAGSIFGDDWESPIFDTLMGAYTYAEVQGWQN